MNQLCCVKDLLGIYCGKELGYNTSQIHKNIALNKDDDIGSSQIPVM